MNSSTFAQQGQTFRPSNNTQHSFQSLSSATMSAFDGQNAFSPPTTVLIRRLPSNTTEDSLRSMVVWSKEFIDTEILPADKSEDHGFKSAILRFKTHAGALEVKNMLDGKPNVTNDAQMSVEVVYGGSPTARRYTVDHTNVGPSSSTSSASSNGPTRPSARYNGMSQRISPPNGVFSSSELPNPESSTHYQSLFSPQSPIGNHLPGGTRITGKSLINNDSVDDDETGEMLKDPVAYAENGPTQGRRQTLPQLPISRLAGLSLNTSASSLSGSFTPIATAMSPLSNGGPPASYQLGSQHYQRHNFPPVNPADQNPPCNTLYVGNLPIDTSEDELKAMFSKQRGYKRLCFRTKQNGPMCFVEFEDVSFATKALHELYGHPLHNSIKGGIRLSFSKNPLGVRSGQGMASPGPQTQGMQGLNGAVMNGSFSTTNGPPPGLSAPPGLSSRSAFTAMPQVANAQYNTSFNNNWNGYNTMTAGGPMNGNNGFPPAYMMGR